MFLLKWDQHLTRKTQKLVDSPWTCVLLQAVRFLALWYQNESASSQNHSKHTQHTMCSEATFYFRVSVLVVLKDLSAYSVSHIKMKRRNVTYWSQPSSNTANNSKVGYWSIPGLETGATPKRHEVPETCIVQDSYKWVSKCCGANKCQDLWGNFLTLYWCFICEYWFVQNIYSQ